MDMSSESFMIIDNFYQGSYGNCYIIGLEHNSVSKQKIKKYLANQNRIYPDAIGIEDLGKSSTEYQASVEYCKENNLEHFIIDVHYHIKDGEINQEILNYSEEVIKENSREIELNRSENNEQTIEELEKANVVDTEKQESINLRETNMALEIIEMMKNGYRNIIVFVGANHARPNGISEGLRNLENKYDDVIRS